MLSTIKYSSSKGKVLPFNQISSITEKKVTISKGTWKKRKNTFSINKKFLHISIFKDDEIYRDPLEVHNESIKKNNFLNSGNLEEFVYNRSNVGMHTILINNKYLNIKTINKLYIELRNSEVNHTKRFVFLTSLYNHIFNYGFHLEDILKIVEIYQKTKNSKYLNVFQKILTNINDLAYLIFSFRKPLISYCNGKVKGSGGFLSFLSKFSSSFTHSSYSYNNLAYSFLPYGGISFVLANLRASLGFYLALTGKTIKSSDLIWSGLTKKWISNDALELMECTSEYQLEVSEQDAIIMLDEHFLNIPKIYSLKEYEEIIYEHFKYDNLFTILTQLDMSSKKKKILFRSGGGANISAKTEKVQNWAKETYEQICSFPPLATHLTFEILNILRNYKIELLNKCQLDKTAWQKLIQNSYKIPKTKKEISMEELKYAIDKELFLKSINIETNTLLNYVSNPDVLTGIASYLVKDTEHSFRSTYLHNSIWDVKRDILLYFLYYKNSYTYQIYDRPDISFSSLSVLEKYNQYYNCSLRTSYDQLFYEKQMQRWDENYLKDEIEEINKNFP